MAKTTKLKASKSFEDVPFDISVIEVDVEDLGNEIVPASALVQKAVDEGLARLDPYKNRISELQTLYSGLTIDSFDDKDGYDNVVLALRDLRGVRVNSGKDMKIGKMPLLAGAKSIGEKNSFIETEVKKIEQPLQTLREWYEAEKERIKAEKKRMQDQQLIQRQGQLYRLGANFDGENFILENVVFEASMIRELDQEIFESDVLSEFQKVYDAKQAAIAAEQLKQSLIEMAAKEAREKLDAEQAAFRAEREAFEQQKMAAAQLAAQEKEFKEQQERQAQIAKERLEHENKMQQMRTRSNQLISLGLLFKSAQNVYDGHGVSISIEQINDLPIDEWNDLISQYSVTVAKNKETARLAQVEQIRIEAEENAIKKHLAEAEAAKEVARIAEIKRQEELDAATDKVKWAAVISAINILPVPDMKNASYKAKIQSLKNYLEKIKSL